MVHTQTLSEGCLRTEGNNGTTAAAVYLQHDGSMYTAECIHTATAVCVVHCIHTAPAVCVVHCIHTAPAVCVVACLHIKPFFLLNYPSYIRYQYYSRIRYLWITAAVQTKGDDIY